jgi:hypothetical protein
LAVVKKRVANIGCFGQRQSSFIHHFIEYSTVQEKITANKNRTVVNDQAATLQAILKTDT